MAYTGRIAVEMKENISKDKKNSQLPTMKKRSAELSSKWYEFNLVAQYIAKQI